MHPEWQVKLANVLILLVLKLNINIYINTHSPMFIEALSLFSEYYGLLNNTNLYLTEINHDGTVYFNHIDSDDMGSVYENLSRPYDDLDDLKSRILFNK